MLNLSLLKKFFIVDRYLENSPKLTFTKENHKYYYGGEKISKSVSELGGFSKLYYSNNDIPDFIMRKAIIRGNQLHDLVEVFLTEKDIKEVPAKGEQRGLTDEITMTTYLKVEPILDGLTKGKKRNELEVLATEIRLVYAKNGVIVAGTVDAVFGNYKLDELGIVDGKSSEFYDRELEIMKYQVPMFTYGNLLRHNFAPLKTVKVVYKLVYLSKQMIEIKLGNDEGY